MNGGKIKTVLFDLDGTLIDSSDDLASAVNFALVNSGVSPQRKEEIIPHIGNGLRDLLSEVMGDVSEEVLKAGITYFSDYYDGHCVDQTVLYPRVYEVLSELSPFVKMGVVTNKRQFYAKKILNQLKADRFFGSIIGGDSLVEKKPHPAPVLKALSDLGADLEGVLILGDGPQDILAGQAAGIKTSVARYGYGYTEALLNLKPDFIIDRFEMIKEIVL